MTELLELKGVTIEYPRSEREPLTIVDAFDLSMASGQMHCLAGRSGSGKTSILRVAAGLTKPKAGTVSWNGTALDGLSEDDTARLRRQTVGYLDQGGNLISGLTAYENVLLPAVPGRQTRKLGRRAADLLRQLGVEAQANNYPDRLSGGERQRVALARALLLEPAVIMADEPTASLDRKTADAVIGLLVELTANGVAVLTAAHDQHLIDAAGTRTTLQ